MKKLTFTTLALLFAGMASGMYSVGDGGGADSFAAQAAKSSKSSKSKAFKKKTKKASTTKKSSGKSARPGAFEGMSLVSSSSWADAAAKRDALAADILKAMGGTSVKEAEALAQDKEGRHLVAQWLVAQAEVTAMAEDAKRAADRAANYKKLQEELEKKLASVPEGVEPSPRKAWDIKQLKKKLERAQIDAEQNAFTMQAALKDPKAATLMEKIAADPEWIEQFAFTGECVRPGMALAIMVKIADRYEDFFTNRMVRDIATATALEYAKSGWNQDDAVQRASFYIVNYKAGRLNTVFDTLPFWQRRMVCGCKGDNPYGSIASLKWGLENVHLPAHEYPGSCWRCSYRLNNIYGDSIHGPQYYAPWEESYGDNREALTYLVGGVCGSLSHFGAFAALANGVPALTAGEPGHCAYIVLVDKKWTPAYSLSWERGLHWQVFQNVYTFSSLHAATEMFDAKTKTNTSNTLRVVGNILSAEKKHDKAMECFEAAVEAQPRNFMAWREWMAAINASSGTAEQWSRFNTVLCKELVPIFPEQAYEVLQKGALAGMEKSITDKKKLRSELFSFWKNCKDYGPDRWHIERLADAQLKALGITNKNAEALIDAYTEVLTCCSSSANYMSVMLGWGNKLSADMSVADKKKFMAGMIKGLKTGKGMSAEDKDKLLSPAILAAEKSGDINTFQALGGMLSEKYTKPANVLPAHKPFPGKLASKGGLVLASSTSKWDDPCSHWGLIEPCGGTFHTGKDTDAWIVVQLPRQVNVTGVVLITNPGNLHRLNNMKIQVSEDGKEWKDVHQFGPCKERVLSVDLQDKLPLAKYVRILRPGGPEFFHLNAIYVYGNQAA